MSGFFSNTSLTQALQSGIVFHLPFTQEYRVKPGHWLTEVEQVSSKAITPKETKIPSYVQNHQASSSSTINQVQ